MKLFEYDSTFMRASLLLSRLTILNLVWLMCCIPVVTAGAAAAAQYYSVKRLMEGEVRVFRTFREGMGLYWKKASAVWIILLFFSAVFGAEYYVLTSAVVPGQNVLVVISALAYLTLILIMLWVYPVMVYFTGTLREILFNAFIFAFLYAPVTLAAAGCYVLAGYLVLRFTIAKGLCLLFGQALIVYAIMAVSGRIFEKYRRQ